VKITHCGVCHTDIHHIDNDWKNGRYPLVPGHEIVGIVTAVGDNVKGIRVGTRVGVGTAVGCCHNCRDCKRGKEHYCEKSVLTYNGVDPLGLPTYGGYAEKIRVDHRFVFVLPEKLPSDSAAPLLCAGVTVWSPLRRYAGTASKVGIVGIGGLGHLAIKFSRALGYETVAISSTADKKAEAFELGAHHFIHSVDQKAMDAHRRSFDLILCTSSASLSWNSYLSLLRTDGVLCLLGLPPGNITVHPALLITKACSVCGSMVGSVQETREMLAFAALHGITANIERFDVSQANDAIARLRANAVRYRAVLTMSRSRL